MEGAQRGPAGPPLPSEPPGRPGAGEPGGAGPGPGEEGGPGAAFSTAPLPPLAPSPSFFSSSLSPQLHSALQVQPRSAPLASPKNALKGNQEPGSGSWSWARGAGKWADPHPQKNHTPHTPPLPPPCKAPRTPCRGAAAGSRVGALSPRVTPPVSLCPWRGGWGEGGGRDGVVGPFLGPSSAWHPLAQLGVPLPCTGQGTKLMVLGCPAPPMLVLCEDLPAHPPVRKQSQNVGKSPAVPRHVEPRQSQLACPKPRLRPASPLPSSCFPSSSSSGALCGDG